MFKYINMPKLVMFYLREFSLCPEPGDKEAITGTNLYSFVFCLCLPFLSTTFRFARMAALAIAECTDSTDQIRRVITKILKTDVGILRQYDEFMLAYDSAADTTLFWNYNGAGWTPTIAYRPAQKEGVTIVVPKSVDRYEAEAYIRLLIPFYVVYEIRYVDTI